jgi:hypothetical protein
MVLVFDQPSDSFTMYLNGSGVASSGGIGGLYRHGRAAIGGQAQWAHFHTGAQNNVANYFAGTLDEIAIYPTALGSAAIAAHYAAGTT